MLIFHLSYAIIHIVKSIYRCLHRWSQSFTLGNIEVSEICSDLYRLIYKRMDEDDHKRTIYVGNLPEGINEQQIFAFFNTFGEIKSIQIPIDHVSEKQRGFAFVEFDEIEDATSAIDNYDQTEFMERTIRVRKSKPMHLKPNYHMPVWHNDDWLQGIENKKIEDEKYTKEMEERNKELGLPIFKNMEKKNDEEKRLVYNEEED